LAAHTAQGVAGLKPTAAVKDSFTAGGGQSGGLKTTKRMPMSRRIDGGRGKAVAIGTEAGSIRLGKTHPGEGEEHDQETA